MLRTLPRRSLRLRRHAHGTVTYGCQSLAADGVAVSSKRTLSSMEEVAHVLCIATEYRQESVILQKCAELLGYRYQMCGFGEPWVGWGTKLVQYQRALSSGLGKEIAPRDPVLLIDGWDTAIVGPAEEFREKIANPQFSAHPVWYAGERLIGPDFFKANRIDAIYPDPGTPWRYPNAGCMAGRADAVLQFLGDLLEGFPLDGNDQGRLHEHVLELGESGREIPAWVDSRCSIFQCLYEAEEQWDIEDVETMQPRLRNKMTGERPVVYHGNGHTGRWFMQKLWRDLRFLERIGLTQEDLAHLPHDGPVAPGTWPDEATERNWVATFHLYRINEMQMAYARQGIKWDPWANAKQAEAKA